MKLILIAMISIFFFHLIKGIRQYNALYTPDVEVAFKAYNRVYSEKLRKKNNDGKKLPHVPTKGFFRVKTSQ